MPELHRKTALPWISPHSVTDTWNVQETSIFRHRSQGGKVVMYEHQDAILQVSWDNQPFLLRRLSARIPSSEARSHSTHDFGLICSRRLALDMVVSA